jgi:hypothetical protein
VASCFTEDGFDETAAARTAAHAPLLLAVRQDLVLEGLKPLHATVYFRLHASTTQILDDLRDIIISVSAPSFPAPEVRGLTRILLKAVPPPDGLSQVRIMALHDKSMTQTDQPRQPPVTILGSLLR